MDRRLTKLNQKGVVAILVSIISIVVISIITVGFAQLARREQRNALDKQLSVEAYYSSEAGVNDAEQALKNGYAGDKTTCDDPSGTFKAAIGGKSSTMVFSPDIVLALGAGSGQFDYTCLLIDNSPTQLVNDRVDSTTPWVIPIKAIKSGVRAHADSLLISWQESSGPSLAFSNKPGPRDFPTPAGWASGAYGSGTGVLRVDATEFTDPANAIVGQLPPVVSQTVDDLAKNTATFFLYPNNNVSVGTQGTADFVTSRGPGKKGAIVDGNCNSGNTGVKTPLFCNVLINLNGAGNGIQDFYLRISSIYNPSKVQISTFGSISPNPQQLTGGQAVIDSTGKVSDVLHRIQVRVNISDLGGSAVPTAALHILGSICKQMDTAPNQTISLADPTKCPL